MVTSQQIVPMKQKVESLRSLLESMKPQLALALPRHLNPDRLARIVLTSCLRNPNLLDCTRESFAGAVLQAAQLGLEPDGVMGMAYLIPYHNRKKNCLDVQFQVGYKGLLDLGRRSGDIGAVDARVVHEKDAFTYRFGLSPILEHTPAAVDRGEVVYVYAIVRLKDGTQQWDVMSVADIEKHRKQYSRASTDGPWVTAWEEMAKKTVLRRVLKFAPASVELQRAIALDEHAEADIPQGLAAIIDWPDAIPAPKKSALEQLTEDMGQPEPIAMPRVLTAGTETAEEKQEQAERVAQSTEQAPPAEAQADPQSPKRQPPDGSVISEAQAKRLYAIFRGAGWEHEELLLLIAKYGHKSTKEILRSEYEEICRHVKNGTMRESGEEG